VDAQTLLTAIALPEDGCLEIPSDIATVEHIDTSALHILTACQTNVEQDKLSVSTEAADPSIRQWIRIAGADELFDFSGGNG
jgi:anti-anti-sigma regulatory factor